MFVAGLLASRAAGQFAAIEPGVGGMALVRLSGDQLTTAHTLQMGATLRHRDGSTWTLAEGARIPSHAADVSGNGRADFIAWGPAALAVLGYQPPQRGTEAIGFQLIANVNNGGRAGGWQVDTTRQLFHGLGDFNGDRRAELLVSGPNAVGLLTLDGSGLNTIAMHVNGTRLGGWIIDTPKNRIEGIGDFNGDGRSDLVITSGWGIGILTLGSNGLTTLMLKPNGTRFGGWLYDSRVNPIQGIGDFNGDGRDDILLTSGWGIGVLTLAGDTLNSLMLKANGTRFGGWWYDSAVNAIRGIGDLDGNGRDDFIITSDWGIGVLTLAGDTFNSLMLKPKGTRFGGWLYAVENQIGQIGDVDGNGRDDFVIRSGWGTGVLTLAGDTLDSLMLSAHGTDLGLWVLSTAETIPVVDRLAGGTSDVLLFHRDGPPPAPSEPVPTTGEYPRVVEVQLPASAIGGTGVSLSIRLDRNAVAAMPRVSLVSSNPAALTVPDYVEVPVGEMSVSLTATTSAVNQPTDVTVTAGIYLEAAGSSQASAGIRIDPQPVATTPSPPPATGVPPATGPAYLFLEGVQGEVTERGYEGQLRVEAWRWGTTTGSGGMATDSATSSKAQAAGMQVTVHNGPAQPRLIEALTTGRVASRAVLTVIDPTNGLPAYRFEMTDVQVTGFRTGSGQGDERPRSDVGLSFGSVVLR